MLKNGMPADRSERRLRSMPCLAVLPIRSTGWPLRRAGRERRPVHRRQPEPGARPGPGDGRAVGAAGLHDRRRGGVSTSGIASPTQENVIQFLTFDEENPNSILSCLRAARENARTVRDMISSEMWEELNKFYLMVCEAAKEAGAAGIALRVLRQDQAATARCWRAWPKRRCRTARPGISAAWAGCSSGPTRPRGSWTSSTICCCPPSPTSARRWTRSSGRRC